MSITGRTGRTLPGTLLALFVLSLNHSEAADEAVARTLLQREIVGSTLPLTEVQWYCDGLVPTMPAIESVAQWEAEAAKIRQNVLDRIVYRGEAARWRDASVQVEWLNTIEGGPGYHIRKLRYEALPGLWIPAVLYEPETLTGKVPVVLNVNGHSPEGKQYVPKQIRCINQAKRGMLALNIEWLGMGQLSGNNYLHYRMNQLDLCGTSGLAPFYLDLKRGLDILLSHEHADPQRVAVTGLSGGGWQTIFFSSLDTRVTLANPVAGYSSFKTRAWHVKDLGDSEQSPNDLATICDYTHLTAIRAPRPTLLTFNLHDDCCFEGAYALEPLVQAVGPVFRLYGQERALRSHVNDDPPGKHNFETDNRQQLYRMIGDFFYPGDATFDWHEIPSDSEVKTSETLNVPIPAGNLDFNSMALSLCQELPREATLPNSLEGARSWQESRRTLLRSIVRAKDLEAVATETARDDQGDVKAIFWKLAMGPWTVPVVELSQGEPSRSVMVVADEGRQSAAAKVAELLNAGYRVFAIDPFYLGESKIAERDFLYALLVAVVGDRPIGLQASQVAAAARWASIQRGTGPISLMAIGPRTSTMALIAGGIEVQAIQGVQLAGSLGSLKEVIEQNWAVNEKPELFCFGLLESFDIRQLTALVAPRKVSLLAPSPRAQSELAGLASWYEMWQVQHDPLSSSAL